MFILSKEIKLDSFICSTKHHWTIGDNARCETIEQKYSPTSISSAETGPVPRRGRLSCERRRRFAADGVVTADGIVELSPSAVD